MDSASAPRPTVFCFAGQGSQYFHMGADLMERHPVFRDWMEIGDRLVRESHGFSLLEAIHAPGRGVADPFDRLEHSHPALFATQFALAKLLQSRGVRPDLLLGTSLGELVAMSVAGMLPFEVALKAVARQPALFAQTCEPGALVAVLAPDSVCAASPELRARTEIAGTSARGHCVLACRATDATAVLEALRRLDAPHQQLPVPFAFHSRWVEPARAAILEAYADLVFEQPFWPVWSACFAAPIERVDAAAIWRIVREPIRLRDTVQALEAAGGARYLDLSPTGSIAAVLRQDLPRAGGSEAVALLSPFAGDLARLDRLFASAV